MRHRLGELVDVSGINVLAADEREFVARFDDSIESGQPMKVAFLNANLFNLTRSNPSLIKLLENFTILNDGVGLNLASLMLNGATFPANMNGTDLIPKVLANTRHSLRIFLIGSSSSAVEKSAIAIEKTWSRHKIVGIQNGYYSSSDEEAIVERIRLAKPDLVLVGLGNPKQEIWISEHIPHASLRAFAIGGLFDFLSEEIPRAPALLRAVNLEWSFRLLQEPSRLWRRYLLGIPMFFSRIARDALVRPWRYKHGLVSAKRLMLVASGGGHWVQLSRLSPAFEGHEALYITTIRGARAPSGDAPVGYVRDVSRSNPLMFSVLFFQMLWILLRFRPDIVITTGAAPGLVALQIGKFFGARTVWIDSLANSEKLSLSGRFARRYADLWLTQWPHLVERYPNLNSFGAVL